jgi:Glycoside-hydrolase family GH114
VRADEEGLSGLRPAALALGLIAALIAASAAGAARPDGAVPVPIKGLSGSLQNPCFSPDSSGSPSRSGSALQRGAIGFDFAIAEECGRFRECEQHRQLFGNRVIVIEYRRQDVRTGMTAVGNRVSVVLRDVDVTRPGSPTYRYATC